MSSTRIAATLSAIGVLALSFAARAQSEALDPVAVDEVALDALDQPVDETEIVLDSLRAAAPEETAPDADEMADELNAQQHLQETFTLKRTINGELVETAKRTVEIPRDAPSRATEAGISARERLLAAFDGEVLTRSEAFEEARLDFTVADANRDDLLTAQEFENLVETWRGREVRPPSATDDAGARQRQYDAFLAEISPEEAATQDEADAKQRFEFLAGASETISRKDYIREYLLDFDSMDANSDTLLTDAELMRFRALNRGETTDM